MAEGRLPGAAEPAHGEKDSARTTPRSLAARIAGWSALALFSAALIAAFEWANLPAAFLIGPMLAGIVLGVRDLGLRLPGFFFAGAQAVVGCLIAGSLSPQIVPGFLANWPTFIGGAGVTLVASSVLGWLISRWNILPGTTGIWGAAPGAASAMVLMAGAFGADQRLVAFMQYLRVIMVSLMAVFVAGLFVGGDGIGEAPPRDWFGPVDSFSFAAVVAVAVIGAGAGRLLRLPSPYFLGPFLLGSVLGLGGGVTLELPPLLPAISFVMIGWAIGLQFDGATLRYAIGALPKLVLGIFCLIVFCGALALAISQLLGVDPLTAYLATSPGAMEVVAIVAVASDEVDVSFVMAMQLSRFLLILALGVPIARFIADRSGGPD